MGMETTKRVTSNPKEIGKIKIRRFSITKRRENLRFRKLMTCGNHREKNLKGKSLKFPTLGKRGMMTHLTVTLPLEIS